jgi:hypothetical protein
MGWAGLPAGEVSAPRVVPQAAQNTWPPPAPDNGDSSGQEKADAVPTPAYSTPAPLPTPVPRPPVPAPTPAAAPAPNPPPPAMLPLRFFGPDSALRTRLLLVGGASGPGVDVGPAKPPSAPTSPPSPYPGSSTSPPTPTRDPLRPRFFVQPSICDTAHRVIQQRGGARSRFQARKQREPPVSVLARGRVWGGGGQTPPTSVNSLLMVFFRTDTRRSLSPGCPRLDCRLRLLPSDGPYTLRR